MLRDSAIPAANLLYQAIRMKERQIIKMLKRIESNLETLLARTDPGKNAGSFNEEDWVPEQVARDKLNRSRRTLLRRRENGDIRWSKRGSEPYYFLPDILRLEYSCKR